MLDNILDLVKGHVTDAISKNPDVPGDKKGEAVEATTNALTDTLKNNLSIAGLTNLFTDNGDNSIADKIQNVVSGALSNKVGLDAGTASGIAASIIPAIVKAITGKIQDPNQQGFNLESVIGAFTGGGSKKGGLLDTIEGFFGKK